MCPASSRTTRRRRLRLRLRLRLRTACAKAPSSLSMSSLAPVVLLCGFGKHRLGPFGFLIELEDLDRVVPQDQAALLFGELGVIQNLHPELVQRQRHADPAPGGR